MATDLLTTAEVAERLRLSIQTVNRYALTGVLPSIQLPGGQRRYRTADIDAILSTTGSDEAAS